MMKKSVFRTPLFPLALGLGLFVSGCGPSVCDCKDALKGALGGILEDIQEGDTQNLQDLEEMAEKCREKYGDMPPRELLDAWKDCE
ncbi:MAG: hypothetical protein D6722_29370 [Bacteroidetes bacterium]|nr:MAG: hypothetical protein D6722_29370 [Bacteroidota bacterium]